MSVGGCVISRRPRYVHADGGVKGPDETPEEDRFWMDSHSREMLSERSPNPFILGFDVPRPPFVVVFTPMCHGGKAPGGTEHGD